MQTIGFPASGSFRYLSIHMYVTVLTVVLMASCTSPPRGNEGTPTPTVFDNEGGVCFTYDLIDSRSYVRIVGPCLSSSCTEILEQQADMQVDQEARVIRFDWRVIVRPSLIVIENRASGCTADCGGGGSFEFETETLQDGQYTVMFGDKIVGSVQVPVVSQACFDSRVEQPVEMTPVATSSPTSTPIVVPFSPLPPPAMYSSSTPTPTSTPTSIPDSPLVSPLATPISE